MRLFLGIAVVAFFTFCGYTFAKKYRKRKTFFAQMAHFNERFLTEISYYKRPLSVFAESLHYKGEFEVFFKWFISALGSVDLIENSRTLLENFELFSEEEKAFIIDYFSLIGKGDSLSQKQYFLAVKTQLEGYRDATKEECEKFGNLYIKLGFLAGLTVLIVIV